MNEKTGRYSFVTADPYLIFRSKGETVELSLPATPAGKYGKRAAMKRKPLQKLRELMSNYRTARIPGLPPFTGGAIGFLSYDFVRQFEKLPQRAVADLDIPEAYFIFVDQVIAFDHILNKAWVIVNPGAREQEMGFRKPDPDQGERLYDEAAERLTALSSKLMETRAGEDGPLSEDAPHRLKLEPNMTQAEFESMVKRCKEYISAGDIYQANLSQRLSVPLGEVDPLRLYTVLREINPSPFAAYLDFEGVTLRQADCGHQRLGSMAPRRSLTAGQQFRCWTRGAGRLYFGVYRRLGALEHDSLVLEGDESRVATPEDVAAELRAGISSTRGVADRYADAGDRIERDGAPRRRGRFCNRHFRGSRFGYPRAARGTARIPPRAAGRTDHTAYPRRQLRSVPSDAEMHLKGPRKSSRLPHPASRRRGIEAIQSASPELAQWLAAEYAQSRKAKWPGGSPKMKREWPGFSSRAKWPRTSRS